MARGLDFRPVLSHPFFLVTFIMAIAGWFAAFIGQAVTEGKYHSEGQHGSAIGVPWFGIFLQLFLTIGVLYALGSDSVGVQRFQLSIFLAIAVVFAVLGANVGVFTHTSYQLAVGAGWLILAIVDIVWLLFFTSEDDTLFVHLFNTGAASSFSPTGGPSHARPSSARASARGPVSSSNVGTPVSGVGGSIGYQNAYANVGKGPAGMSVGELAGPGEDMNGGTVAAGNGTRSPTSGGGGSLLSQGPEYTLKAKALYSYSASPDDPNEISFTKGDLLDIVDNSGKWWQARKQDGTKGIVPSNYVVLM